MVVLVSSRVGHCWIALGILHLREEALATLGDDFDLAGFHDAVLRHGSVPLAVLPLAVDAWVETLG